MVRVFVGHPWNISIPDKIPIIVELSDDEREKVAMDFEGTLKKIKIAQKYLAWVFSEQFDKDNALARKGRKKKKIVPRAVRGMSVRGGHK